MPYEHHKAIDDVKHAEAELAAAVSARACCIVHQQQCASQPFGVIACWCACLCVPTRFASATWLRNSLQRFKLLPLLLPHLTVCRRQW